MGAQVVSFRCVLSDRVGKVISSTFNQDVITQAEGPGAFLKGLAEGLKDLIKGERRRIQVSADQAYGFYDLEMVLVSTREKLIHGHALKVGDEVPHPSWKGKARVFRVIQADRHSVTLDGNHPLAGQDLVFEIEATDAREATLAELAENRLADVGPRLH